MTTISGMFKSTDLLSQCTIRCVWQKRTRHLPSGSFFSFFHVDPSDLVISHILLHRSSMVVLGRQRFRSPYGTRLLAGGDTGIQLRFILRACLKVSPSSPPSGYFAHTFTDSSVQYIFVRDIVNPLDFSIRLRHLWWKEAYF